MAEQSAPQFEFVDHYYTLGIDVDANGEIIEDTYWHIIREWRAGRMALTSRNVDHLNEAYRVLTTPELRRRFDAEREAVLGPNARPQPPQTDEPEPPLRIMEKELLALHRDAPEEPDEPEPEAAPPANRWLLLAAGAGSIAAMLAGAIIKLLL